MTAAPMAAAAAPAALDTKRVLKEKTIEGAHTPDEWLAALTPLAEQDRQGDRRRRNLMIATIAGFVLGAIALALGVAIAGGPLLALAVVGLVAFFVMKRQDLSNRLRDFVLPLLVVLREEMAAGQPVTLRLDLRGATRPEKKVDVHKSGGGLPRHEDTFYIDPWLTVEARLGDGTRLVWEVVDDVRQRRVTRRNRRGKVKTKTKYKTKTEMAARLATRRDEYAPVALPVTGEEANPATSASGDRLAIKAGARRDVVEVKRVVIERASEPKLDPRHFIEMVGAAYGRVTPIHAEEEAS